MRLTPRSSPRLTGGPRALTPATYVPAVPAPAGTPSAVEAHAPAPVAQAGHAPAAGAWPAWAPPADEPVLDLGQLWAVVGFPWRALRRHRRLAGGVGAAVAAVALLVALLAPRRYDVETSIMAQRNFVMPALGNPRRAVPTESDAPTRMAAEAVLSRASLDRLVEEAGLEAAWPRLRSPLGRARDAVTTAVRGAPTAADRRDQLVGYLRKQLWVVADEGTVRIGVRLPDARLALRVVQLAEGNFLAQRQRSEQQVIRESMDILQAHIGEARARIDSTMADVRRYAPQARAPRAALLPLPTAAPRRAPGDAALADQLTATRAAIAAADGARAQRVGTLQARLLDLRNTLGPAHPDVVATEQALRDQAAEPRELAALRATERTLAARLGPSAAAAGGDEAAFTRAALARLTEPAVDTIEDPRLTLARSRLKMAVADYEDLLDRFEGARIEYETARAAFKYRFSIITPPQLPKRPASPGLALLLVGGGVLAGTLAVFAALVADLAGGRVVESWQVARLVGVPVLGEVPRS